MSSLSRKVLSSLFLSIIVTVTSVSVNAQQSGLGGIQVGPGYLTSMADLKLFYDDNLFDSVSGSELETLGWLLSPNATYELKNNISKFVANWDLEAGFYDDSSDDDYVDNTLSALVEYQPVDRFRGALKGEYKDTHDPRGTGRAEGVLTGLTPDQDKWHSYTIDANVGLGTQTAITHVEGDIAYVTKEYDNNRLDTMFRDRDDVLTAARVFYRLAPKTSLVVDGRYATTRYKFDAPLTGSLDSDTYHILGGLTWEATARTTGSFKIGYIEKDFKVASRTDGDAINWEANIQWAPRTYSIVNLTTSRDFGETNGAGDFIESDTYSVDWTHFWSDRISTTTDVAFIQDSFEPTTREDDKIYAGLRLDYMMQRWLTIGGGYRYEDRDSNRDDFDYNKGLFMLNVTVKL